MRIALLCAVVSTALASGCGSSSKEPAPWPAARFLPASADLVVRLDLPRLRAWSHVDQASATALAGLRDLLDAGKRTCNLDLVAEASAVVVARKGPLTSGDTTLIARGLDRAKVTGCLAAIASATPSVKLPTDGDVFHVEVSGRSLASGAFLPGGEVVVVSRAGAGVAPDAWKTEVAGRGEAPAYWAELDGTQPVAVRVADAQRTVLASAQVGDPLVLRGKVVAASEAHAKADAARMRAIAEYLQQAGTGTARIEPRGATIHADFTATGAAQIDSFVKIALPVAVGGGAPPRDLVADLIGAPGDCSLLAGAVETYLGASLAKAPPSRRAELEAQMPRLVPALQKSYVDACTADQWSASVVRCHVDQATALARFERCRLLLPEGPRGRFDQAVADALKAFTP